MKYNKQLPPVRNLLTIAKDVHFPASRQEVEDIARSWGFTSVMTDFLDLFPADEIFISKVDFMTRCEELEMLINQEREMPTEVCAARRINYLKGGSYDTATARRQYTIFSAS